MKAISTAEYKKMSLEETAKLLAATPDGLSGKEADSRRSTFGYNKIEETKKNPLQDLFKRYWGPMPWLLNLPLYSP